MSHTDLVESMRLQIQDELDSSRDQAERNRLGQFATPTDLATDILQYGKCLVSPSTKVRFLDPAIGTGSFYSALLRLFSRHQVRSAVGYEIDPMYADKASTLWGDTSLELHIGDFTQATPPASDETKANLLICNPPYVRHHHLSSQEKLRLQTKAMQATGLRLNGLTGLYCYFLLISHNWLATDGIAGWLVPSEFMSVNYGQQVKEYLLSRVSLLRIHRFDPSEVQFDDALVSSAVVWLKNARPTPDHTVELTFGGSLTKPRISKTLPVHNLRRIHKWTSLTGATTSKKPVSKLTLSRVFNVKRGLATGANKFFILTPDQISKWQLPGKFLLPVLPSPRHLSVQKIDSDSDGNPILDRRLFLISCNLPEEQVREEYPRLWDYFEYGIDKGVKERYLCQNRSPWYSQETRSPTPFLCTYMGRRLEPSTTPFRFLLNKSKAIATNVYLMLYPQASVQRILGRDPQLVETVWKLLDEISADILVEEGRVYGGGLHKIEPKELGNVPANAIIATLTESCHEDSLTVVQNPLFDDDSYAGQ